MVFDPKRLTSEHDTPYSRHAKYSHGTDGKAEVEAANYFDAAYAALPVGATLDCALDLDTTPVRRSYIVTASSSSGVTIAKEDVV